jgi:hypothetical protein
LYISASVVERSGFVNLSQSQPKVVDMIRLRTFVLCYNESNRISFTKKTAAVTLLSFADGTCTAKGGYRGVGGQDPRLPAPPPAGESGPSGMHSEARVAGSGPPVAGQRNYGSRYGGGGHCRRRVKDVVVTVRGGEEVKQCEREEKV